MARFENNIYKFVRRHFAPYLLLPHRNNKVIATGLVTFISYVLFKRIESNNNIVTR